MTDSGFTIRPVSEEDIEPIAVMIDEIEKYYGSPSVDPFDVRRRQTSEALFGLPPIAHALVCVDDQTSETVGFAAYSFMWPAMSATHTVFVKELFVTELYRNRGLGLRLLDAVRDVAKARPDCSRVEWTADRENSLALNFYRTQGFEIYEDKICYRWVKD